MESEDFLELPLANFIKYMASGFWYRIEFVRGSKGLRISETTLTEDLIFNFHLMSKGRNFPVRLFQSVNEKTNGSDIEILLQLNDAVYKFPCQAKIIYANRRYGALRHSVGGKYQADLLLEYANRIGGYALYLFYNYDEYQSPELLDLTDGVPHPWGCSFGSAEVIRDQFFVPNTPAPLFRELHPGICWPFHMFFESLPGKSKEKMLSEMLRQLDICKLRAYSLASIEEDKDFEEVTRPGEIGKISHFDYDPFRIGNRSVSKEQQGFNPRYRILITTRKTGGVNIAYKE